MGGSSGPVILEGPGGSGAATAIVGCGGAGCNMLAEGMIRHGSVRIALGSEPRSMKFLSARKLLVEPAGIARDALAASRGGGIPSSETESRLADMLGDVDAVFVVAGLGGLTGGWGAVVACRAARLRRRLAFSVLSEPFSVEGGSRRARARKQASMLMDVSDLVLVMPNDMLLAEARDLPINQSFGVMNRVLASLVNLFHSALGTDDMRELAHAFSGSRLASADSVRWDRDDAPYALAQALTRSRWLMHDSGAPGAALLVLEGDLAPEEVEETGRHFARMSGCGKVLVARAAEREGSTAKNPARGIRATAVVGF